MSEWEEQVARATGKVEDVLSEQMYQLNGCRVTKFVASFEYIDTDGVRAIASIASPGLMKWDVEGLLRYILKNDELDSIKQIIEGNESG